MMSSVLERRASVWILGSLIALLAVAVGYLSVAIDRQQEQLRSSLRYDLTWGTSQSVVELLRVGQVLGAYVGPTKLATADEVRLRFEIFLSRIVTFEGAEFQAVVPHSRELAASLTALRQAASELQPLIEQVEVEEQSSRAIAVIAQAIPHALATSSAIYDISSTGAYRDGQKILNLHSFHSALTLGLVAAAVLLLISFGRRSHALVRERAKAEVAELARQEAESGNRAKSEFLANMSHEMRTPLHGIMGFTDIVLARDDILPEVRRQLELIRTSGNALLTVINDVLDFSQIESGTIELDANPFTLQQLAADCQSIVQPSAAKKHLQLEVTIDPHVPPDLLGDRARLQQVVLNLLNNAVKFTPAGRVGLSVTMDPVTGPHNVRFEVSDTGIGIPPHDQGRLFNRFSQVDGSTRRVYGGTGLGLAISKTLVEVMGGEIGVRSEPGQGSTFWMTVPLPAANHPDMRSTGEEPTSPRKPAGARILLAEDVEINQEIARAILEASGHEVWTATNGAEAIMALQKHAFDLVLMDIQMPVMDGLAATRHIRALQTPLRGIPIIAMTANVFAEQIAGFRQAGMDDHVGKPFKREELLAAVSRCLTRRAGVASIAA